MPAEQVRGLVSFIGLAVQLGGCLFLAGLFSLLSRNAPRRAYFGWWAQAWLVVAAALLALTVRSLLLPGSDDALRGWDATQARALYLVYQVAKLLYSVLLVSGTVAYVTGLRSRAFVRAAIGASAVYAAASVALSPQAKVIVIWQAPVTAAALGYCAAALLRLPRSRRSLGSTVTGLAFTLSAALWALFLAAYIHALVTGGAAGAILGALPFYGSYLDVMMQVLLGYGMVLMLMEGAQKEVNDARAELQLSHDQLRRAALFDPLTGALNRRAFIEGVGLELARSTFGTVIMLDLDNLKMVNDSYGHGTGDELLKHLVSVLRGALRPSDRIYRWGGDEFLIVLPGAPAGSVRDRVEAAIAAAPPVHVYDGPGELRLVVSAGNAQYRGAEEMADAIERADAAMYGQKHARKGGTRRRAKAG